MFVKKIGLGPQYSQANHIINVPCRPTAPEYEVVMEVIGTEVTKFTSKNNNIIQNIF